MSFLPRALLRNPAFVAGGYVPSTLNLLTDNFAGSTLDPLKWRKSVGKTVTISGTASPAVVTCTSHGFVANQQVQFITTGTLPTPMDANGSYFVSATGLTTNTFEFSATNGGAVFNNDGGSAGSGTHTAISIGYSGAGLASNTVSNNLLLGVGAAAGVNYGGIEAVNYYNLTANGIYVKCSGTTGAASIQQLVNIVKDVRNLFGWFNDGSNGLRVVTTIAGTQTVQATYSWPGAATWVRIREAGGTVFWDTAPDSGSLTPGTWTNRFSMATPFVVTSIYPTITSGNYAVTTAETETFGGFNTTALS